eukprot:950433-Pleurochrysis_carterae.AAC.4
MIFACTCILFAPCARARDGSGDAGGDPAGHARCGADPSPRRASALVHLAGAVNTLASKRWTGQGQCTFARLCDIFAREQPELRCGYVCFSMVDDAIVANVPKVSNLGFPVNRFDAVASARKACADLLLAYAWGKVCFSCWDDCLAHVSSLCMWDTCHLYGAVRHAGASATFPRELTKSSQLVWHSIKRASQAAAYLSTPANVSQPAHKFPWADTDLELPITHQQSALTCRPLRILRTASSVRLQTHQCVQSF